MLHETFGNFAFAIACRVLSLRDMGPALSPFNAFLILTGIETLPLRMQRHCDNAKAVARMARQHPKVAWVSYPGLAGDRYHNLAKKYAPKGAGAVFTFGLKGGYDAGVKLVSNVKLFSHLANIGDTRSLIIHPASTTHRQLSDAQKVQAGAGPDVVRLSIGLEDKEDIIADLEQALPRLLIAGKPAWACAADCRKLARACDRRGPLWNSLDLRFWRRLRFPPAMTAHAQPTTVILATATPGGGFPLFGDNAAAAINETDPSLTVETRNTKGSAENIGLLEHGTMDIALVAGEPAYEAFAGIGRAPTTSQDHHGDLFQSRHVRGARATARRSTLRDLVGKPIAWGTHASGLTLLGRYVIDGLGLDREKDFQAIYLDKAGDGPLMVVDGRVAALWGGGIGWPGFTAVMQAGGRFIGLTPDEVARVSAKHNFLKPITVPAGAYPRPEASR